MLDEREKELGAKTLEKVNERLLQGNRAEAVRLIEAYARALLNSETDSNTVRELVKFIVHQSTTDGPEDAWLDEDDADVIFEAAEGDHAFTVENDGSHTGRFLHDLGQLKKEQRTGRPIPWDDIEVTDEHGVGIKTIPISKVHVMLSQFQPRSFVGQRAERYTITKGLTEAIANVGVAGLDPVVIWWSGERWYVVDGHHRLDAIKRWNLDTKKVTKGKRLTSMPVVVREGDLSEALKATTEENGKVRLTLPKKQRQDRAWKTLVLHRSGLVGDGKFVMAQWHRVLHVSERQLQNMNAIWRKLREQAEAKLKRELQVPRDAPEIAKIASMSWWQAERTERGEVDEDEIDMELKRQKAVQEFAERLARVFPKDAFGAGKAEFLGEALLEVSSAFFNHALGSENVREASVQALRVHLGEFDWNLLENPKRELEVEAEVAPRALPAPEPAH